MITRNQEDGKSVRARGILRCRTSAPSSYGTSARAAARSTGTTDGSASPGSAGSPGTARRPAGRCARRCRPACRPGSCPSRTAGPARSVAIFRVRPEDGSRRVATCSGFAVIPLSRTQLWSRPLAVQQLLVRDPDVLADRLRAPEVEGGARDLGQLAGGDEARVDRRVAGGGDLQLVVVDRAAALARQVPVDVAGEVDDGRLVGGGLVVDAPVAVLGERVRDLHLERAGVAHLAVDAACSAGAGRRRSRW